MSICGIRIRQHCSFSLNFRSPGLRSQHTLHTPPPPAFYQLLQDRISSIFTDPTASYRWNPPDSKHELSPPTLGHTTLLIVKLEKCLNWPCFLQHELPVDQMVFRAQLRSTLWEDPLGQEMATHSGILTRKTPWTEEPGSPPDSPRGRKRAGQDLETKRQQRSAQPHHVCKNRAGTFHSTCYISFS